MEFVDWMVRLVEGRAGDLLEAKVQWVKLG